MPSEIRMIDSLAATATQDSADDAMANDVLVSIENVFYGYRNTSNEAGEAMNFDKKKNLGEGIEWLHFRAGDYAKKRRFATRPEVVARTQGS